MHTHDTDLVTDLVSDLDADLVSDLDADLVSDLNPDLVSDLDADLVSDLDPDLVSDLNPDLVSDQGADQSADLSADQCHNQAPDLSSDYHPLQSFLEDGLPGFVPHQLKFEKGKLECSIKKHFTLPCKTPMGFADISVTASNTETGKHLYSALVRFCGDESSPLSKLYSQLNCLLPSAPQTLGDMLGFYYSFLNGWDTKHDGRLDHRETAFKSAVQKANFENSSTQLDVTAIFKHSYHGTKNTSTHHQGDLFSLVRCQGYSSDPAHPCGPYLRSIGRDIYSSFSKENADKYLSWIVYLTESFYNLLKELYEECNARCGGEKPKCRIARCAKNCSVTDKTPGSNHSTSCNSIINCASTSYTLCRYGLLLGARKELSGTEEYGKKHTCKDFCRALNSVLNDKETDKHALAELIYRTIPEYLLKIRWPFMLTVLSLWLLSLLYLLHIMAIRLDLLHIKSHLHSPSSHRIAAQSLLAAGRVNKLNRVFYLQP